MRGWLRNASTATGKGQYKVIVTCWLGAYDVKGEAKAYKGSNSKPTRPITDHAAVSCPRRRPWSNRWRRRRRDVTAGAVVVALSEIVCILVGRERWVGERRSEGEASKQRRRLLCISTAAVAQTSFESLLLKTFKVGPPQKYRRYSGGGGGGGGNPTVEDGCVGQGGASLTSPAGKELCFFQCWMNTRGVHVHSNPPSHPSVFFQPPKKQLGFCHLTFKSRLVLFTENPLPSLLTRSSYLKPLMNLNI